MPFILWLVAGLVPWFFVQDGLINGTNALIEYNYLVKKVVFKISILPMVKIISALFVHLFFIVVVLVLYACHGYFPDLYVLQLIYYSFSVFVLILGISYLTSAVVVFFRDLSQIINIAPSGGRVDDADHVELSGSGACGERNHSHHLETESDLLYRKRVSGCSDR